MKIIDGEVVSDNDPRARASAASSGHPSAASSRLPPGQPGEPPGEQRPVFDWNRPVLRTSPDPPGEGIGSIPGLDIFGAHMRAVHALAILAAVLFLGLKGLLLGGGVWVLYKLNQASSGAAVPGQQGGRGAAQSAQQFFQQFMQQQPGAGSGTGGGPVGGRQGGPSAGGGGRQAGGDSWTAKGKPHKLGSA